MEIGEEQDVTVIEPVESPVPGERQPAAPEPIELPEPVEVPEAVPA